MRPVGLQPQHTLHSGYVAYIWEPTATCTSCFTCNKHQRSGVNAYRVCSKLWILPAHAESSYDSCLCQKCPTPNCTPILSPTAYCKTGNTAEQHPKLFFVSKPYTALYTITTHQSVLCRHQFLLYTTFYCTLLHNPTLYCTPILYCTVFQHCHPTSGCTAVI